MGNGAQFICPTPKYGPQAFLHMLFAPASDDALIDIEDLFGFSLPQEYADFLAFSNGSSLFQHTFSLFGCGGNFSRSLEAQDQAAVSLTDACMKYRVTNDADWLLGWRPVGSLVALSLYTIAINRAGIVMVQGKRHGSKNWPSFFLMLLECIELFDKHFNCDGIVGDDYTKLEGAIDMITAPRAS